MIARVQSYLLQGIDAIPCEVEIDLDEGDGFPSENPKRNQVLVGLPDAAVKECLERVRSAMGNSAYLFPLGRMVINFAPADVRKEGPLYDLAVAIGVLICQGVVHVAGKSPSRRRVHLMGAGAGAGAGASLGVGGRPGSPVSDAEFQGLDHRQYLFAGELALDGRIRPVRGVIAMATLARARGLRGVIVPADNVEEAAAVAGVDALGVRTLSEVVGILNGHVEAAPHPPLDVAAMIASTESAVDFGDVRGQEAVKRAIVVAAGGLHNLLMLGPAGTGKSMMARALPGVLPPLTADEAIEITRVYSAAGQLPHGRGLITTRPVRTPHHTSSSVAVVGGGAVPRPGEISLAHRGILFLDELPEFSRAVLETLRQPLEDHAVTIARSHSSVRFPAAFMLVCALNPTPKGDMPGDDASRREMDHYLSKLSGPLIDRIDIHVEAPAVPWTQLSSAPRGTGSAAMADVIAKARRIQNARQGPMTPNSRLSGRQLDELAPLDEAARSILGQAMSELKLSARAYDKIRRVARTIADLEGQAGGTIAAAHVAEAVQYRLLDRRR